MPRAHCLRLGEPPPPPAAWLLAASAGTDTDWLGLAAVGLGACRVPSWNEGETCPAMRSRRWHQCLPRELSSASQDIPNSVNKTWGGRPARLGLCQAAPHPSHQQGGLPSSGTGWEHSMSCWECCPHKSPGDAASRHLPRSLGRVPRAVICPVSSEPGLAWSAVGRAGTSTCTTLFRSANTFKAVITFNNSWRKARPGRFPRCVGNWGPVWNLGYTAIEGAMQMLTRDCCLPISFSSGSRRPRGPWAPSP
uniref:Uncharacterized protein n=1 Tax=Myotis myotis TaxID=51298 RepID=A0A7J7Y0G1_MYOMY|nr:hypothetical protein mMyoMyo1_011456 [Myotis myotis]